MRPWIVRLLLAGVALSVIAAFGWLAVQQRRAAPGPVAAMSPSDPASPGGAPADAPAPATPPPAEPGFDPAADGVAWASIDLEDIRSALPDNTYWQMAMPTDDARVLEARDEERARWNEAYGKVLSGTASREEIDAYYDHRHRVSSDYVEFTRHVLAHYGDQLPPRDVSLLELAQRLHLARLAEMPRKVEEAYTRKEEQERARKAYEEQEKRFADEE